MTDTKLTSDTVRRLCGGISDRKIEEILATGADLEALEEALAWSAGDDEHTPKRHLAPHGPAARIVEILVADDEYQDASPR